MVFRSIRSQNLTLKRGTEHYRILSILKLFSLLLSPLGLFLYTWTSSFSSDFFLFLCFLAFFAQKVPTKSSPVLALALARLRPAVAQPQKVTMEEEWALCRVLIVSGLN
jgi:hypothetical protein